MSTMQQAYNLAALAVRQRLAEQHPERLHILNQMGPQEIAVYAGSYDRVEDILSCLQLPYQMNPKPSTLKARIVFVNCSNQYDNHLIQQLRQQVEQGVWLVSSDWALGRFVAQAFPNTIRWNQHSTRDEVISVEPGLHSLWSEVVVLGADPQWWLESSSHAIEVLNPERVQIEAASHDLLASYNAPVVAVSFDWGQGHVFHVISHFWCKRSRTPTPRHQGPCTDFLQTGMKLSQAGIDQVLQQAKLKPDTLNFAMMQTAATATELVAQLCIQAGQSSFPQSN